MKNNHRNIKVDIGCGNNKKSGFLGLDLYKLDSVDIVTDLNKEPLPFKDNSVQEIYSSHFLEHVDNPEAILKEIARTLCVGGTATLIVPHYSNPYSYHFTHKSFWSSYSLENKYLEYYVSPQLKLVNKNIHFSYFKYLDGILNYIFNLAPNIYERFFSTIIKAWEIEFTLTKTSYIRTNKNLIKNLH